MSDKKIFTITQTIFLFSVSSLCLGIEISVDNVSRYFDSIHIFIKKFFEKSNVTRCHTPISHDIGSYFHK